MDKSTLIELAENEVFESDQYDYNPEVRGFQSLFSNQIRSRINDLNTAISFYESLTEEQIERRYSIQYWEVCAIGAYDFLHLDFVDCYHLSIDKRELVRRELTNVELLLNAGKCLILPSHEDLCISEIPAMYEKLVTGTWTEFLNSAELEAYETAHQDHEQNQINPFTEGLNTIKDKENRDELHLEWINQNLNKGPKYIDYFNIAWLASMQIQALVWYKQFLEKTSEKGELFFENRVEEIKNHSRTKKVSMASLRRSNDGHQAITASFSNFVAKHHGDPQWSELMAYMVENPPPGFVITGKRRGTKVEHLTIEGSDKPIDRAAFKKRYERYFPKMDNKRDNN